jgi:hypothetical protein
MLNIPIVSHLWHSKQVPVGPRRVSGQDTTPIERSNLHELAQNPANLPRFVQESAVAMRYLDFLGVLDWASFPERSLQTTWGAPTLPFAPFVAACLVKLDQPLPHFSKLRDYLVEHPALVWVLGFPLVPSSQFSWGFDAEASLPTQRHFTRMLHKLPNTSLQFLLDETVRLIQAELATEVHDFGQTISLDTKHVIAWVKENNPKTYLNGDRYDKTKQPTGDPDCRLGCKRRHNQRTSSQEAPPTPTRNPIPANTLSVGEFFWGYGTGVVGTRVPGWSEFVLAELTQPFNKSDVSYFFPLMADVERRLGFCPKFGAFDAAFDAHLCLRVLLQRRRLRRCPFLPARRSQTHFRPRWPALVSSWLVHAPQVCLLVKNRSRPTRMRPIRLPSHLPGQNRPALPCQA